MILQGAGHDLRGGGGAAVDQSFTDLASAETFFSNHLIGVPLFAGPNNVQFLFSETMSSAGGFSFDYAIASSGVGAPPNLARTEIAAVCTQAIWTARAPSISFCGAVASIKASEAFIASSEIPLQGN